MATLRRWSVVLIVFALFLLYNREIPLAQDERSYVTAPYQSTHDIYQIQARYYSRNQINVSMLATPMGGGQTERLNVIYDRQHKMILSSEKEGYGTPPLKWFGQFALIFALISLWLLYLDPLIAGRYCPHCRTLGVFPRILSERSLTLFPSVMAEDGDLTPEIIESEKACPSCSFREYSIREHTISLQGNLITELKGSVNAHRSMEDAQQDIKELEQRAREKGINRELHCQRIEQAKAAARVKTSPRT